MAGSRRDIAAFGTPTVIHFCTALLISALMTAPWQLLAGLGACVAALGVVGLAYSVRVIRHARNANYRPDGEDWFWYIILSLFGHAPLVGGGVMMWWTADWSFVTVAITSLIFLLLGVHNAWDTVTHVAVQHGGQPTMSDPQTRPSSEASSTTTTDRGAEQSRV